MTTKQIFKSNNRFDVLAEEDSIPKKKEKRVKAPRETPPVVPEAPPPNDNNRFLQTRQPRLPQPRPSTRDEWRLQKNQEMQRVREENERTLTAVREREKEVALAMDSFPQILPTMTSEKTIGETKWKMGELKTHLERQEEPQEEVERPLTDFERLPHGWTILRFNRQTGRTEMMTKRVPGMQKKKQRYTEDKGWTLLKQLQEDRKRDYIDQWGYEDWERNFGMAEEEEEEGEDVEEDSEGLIE